jgi:hypothetical protein
MSSDPLSAFHEPTSLQPDKWQGRIETAPDSDPIDLEPSDLRSDVTLLRGIIGELLHDKYPDGYAMPTSRLTAIAAGCGHKWQAGDKGGAYQIKIVNGS